jgi:hypothetical protein
MSRHQTRQKLAREFGATDIVTERGDEGVARVKELTNGVGADSVLECVGTQESMAQAIRSTRPGGSISYVGVPHGVELDAAELFYTHVHLHGGPAPVRRTFPSSFSWCRTGPSIPARSSSSSCRSSKWPKATEPWTSAAPSRRCCVRRLARESRQGNLAGAYHSIARRSWKNPPDGPSSGSVASQTIVSAPSRGERGADGPPMSVRTHPGSTAFTSTPLSG